MFWCVKKDEFTATCKLGNRHKCGTHGIQSTKNIMQKKEDIGFSSQLVEACDIKNGQEASSSKQLKERKQ